MYDISIDSNENDVNTIPIIGEVFFIGEPKKLCISYTIDYYLFKKKCNQFLNKIKYGFDRYI